MITEDAVSPEPVFGPKGGVKQRVILLGGSQFKPDFPQTMKRLQCRAGHVAAVIPEHSAIQRREISCDHGAQKEQTERKIPLGNRRHRIGTHFPHLF